MSDRHAGFGTASRRVPTAHVTLPRLLAVLSSALLVASAFGESGGATATVGFVLAEALVLYAGYGALMRVASPAVRERLERE